MPTDLEKIANSPTVQLAAAPDGHGYRLEALQFLPRPRNEVFEFFSDAFQLESLTPAWLRFSVLTPPPILISAGTLIDYKLRVRGVPIRWQSKISVWEPPYRFVDDQVRGPYRRWHHEHTFEECDGGTLCRDIVDYSVYGGALINALFVRSDVKKIFEFRQQQLRAFFPPAANASAASSNPG